MLLSNLLMTSAPSANLFRSKLIRSPKFTAPSVWQTSLAVLVPDCRYDAGQVDKNARAEPR